MIVTSIVIATALFMTVLAPSPASGQADPDAADPAAQESDAGTTDDGETTPPEIIFPVVGPVSYLDTWGACRGVRCSRGHKGVDIFGHKLAPLVAAADGVITSDRRSGMTISGNTVIIRGDDGWRYLYIHLNNDAPGTDDGSNPQGWIIPNRLRVGDRVKAGDVIGYLGDSGNAESTPAHVHFEIHEPGVGAINPTPMVSAAEDAGRIVPVSSLSSTPEGRAEYGPTVSAWYRALLKREPTESELFAWSDRFDIGFATTDDLIADLTMSKPRRDPAGAIIRSFRVALNRLPTLNELRQWEQQYKDGATLEEITKILVESNPFTTVHGDLSDEEFIHVVYRNALGVGPSAKRLDDWLTAFSEESSRATLTAYLANTYSVKNSTWHGLEVVQAFRASLDRLPTGEEYDVWVDHLNAGGMIPDVVAGIRNPPVADDEDGEETGDEADVSDAKTDEAVDDTADDTASTDGDTDVSNEPVDAADGDTADETADENVDADSVDPDTTDETVADTDVETTVISVAGAAATTDGSSDSDND